MSTPIRSFHRLVEVCQKNALPVDCLAPKAPPIAAGELFLGQPFDPLLAALYAQTDGAMLGDLQIFPIKEPENVLLSMNEGMRRWGEEPYLSALLFGKIPLLAYYLAVVPSLADAKGAQPVVFIDAYERNQVLPIASNVEAFLSLFAVYLERAVVAPEFTVEHRIGLHFPEGVVDLVARDQALVGALVSGFFDHLTSLEARREWVSRLAGTSC